MKVQKSGVIVGLIFSAAATTFLLAITDFGNVAETVTSASAGAVMAAVAASTLAHVLRAQRWWWLLLPIGRFSILRDVLPTYILGQGLNMLLAFRSGDLIRTVVLARRTEQNAAGILTTVVIEKLWDAALLLLCTGLVILAAAPAEVRPGSTGVYAIVTVTGAVVLVGFLRPRAIKGGARSLFVRLPARPREAISRAIESILRATQSTRDLRTLSWATALTATAWIASYFVHFAILAALNIDVPWYAPLVVLVTMNFGTSVPAMPGNLGVAHVLAFASISLFGVSTSDATAYALLAHGIPFVWQSLLAVGAMVFLGVSWRAAKEVANDQVGKTERGG